MDNIDLIIENYRQLSTNELLSIAKNPAELRIDIIPHLQSELFNRNKKEEALLLSEFLIKRPKTYAELTKDELSENIKERIDSGESLESIKLDLKENGVNMLDILSNEAQIQNKTFDYLASLKSEGLDDAEIDEKMKSTFSLTENETDVLKRQLKAKGKQNLIIGYSLVIVMSILTIVSLSMGGYVGIGGILAIGIGIWRISEGYRQTK